MNPIKSNQVDAFINTENTLPNPSPDRRNPKDKDVDDNPSPLKRTKLVHVQVIPKRTVKDLPNDLLIKIFGYLPWINPPEALENQEGRSDRYNAELACRSFREMIHREFDMREDVLAKAWFKEFKHFVVLLNDRPNGIGSYIELKIYLKNFSIYSLNYNFQTNLVGGIDFQKNNLKYWWFHHDANPNICVCYHQAITTHQQSSRNNFQVFLSYAMRPNGYYTNFIATLNQAVPGDRPFNGECLTYVTTKELQQVNSLVPRFTRTREAIEKLMDCGFRINFLPLALNFGPSAEGMYFGVQVYCAGTTRLSLFLPTTPFQCIRVAASLIDTVYNLHGLGIVAHHALFFPDIMVDQNHFAFLSNYTALTLASDSEEERNQQYDADVKKLGEILLQVFADKPDLEFFLPFINWLQENDVIPDMITAQEDFLDYVNSHFKLNGQPIKMKTCWDVLVSQPLTLAQ